MQDSENVCKNWGLLSGPHLENFHSPDKKPFIWKNIANHISNQGLVSRTYKEPSKLTRKNRDLTGVTSSVLKLGYSDKLTKLIELYT